METQGEGTQRTAGAVEMLEEAFRWMDKALRSLTIYTREHQVARSFEASTGQHLAAIPDQEGETWLEIRAKAILHGEREVYREPPESDGFVFRMHRDGIRRLCLLPGLDLDEVGRLVRVFQADLDAPEHFDDDMVTLLWEADLEHVKVVVADLLTVLPDDADLRPCQDMMDRIIAAAMETRLEQGQAPARDGETIRMATQAFGELDPGEVAAVLTGVDAGAGATPYEDEQQRASALRAQLDADDSLERFVEILYRGVALDPVHAEHAGATFDLLVQALVRAGRYADLLRVITLVADLGQDLVGTADAAGTLLASLAHRERVAALVDSLAAPDAETGVVLDILGRLPAEHVGDLLTAAARLSHRERRAELTRVIAALGRPSPQVLEPYLESSSPMEVRMALDALLAIGTEEALAALRSLRQHESADMRITMLRLTQDLVSPALTEVRRAMLEDPHPRVRAEAERCLARLADPELVKRLFRRLVDGTLRDQSPAEKRRVCAILGAAGGRHQIKLLQELVKRGRVLSGRRQLELCVAAAHGLAATGDRKHLEVLEQTAEKRLMARQVREACREAAESLRAGRKPMISVAVPPATVPAAETPVGPEPAAPEPPRIEAPPFEEGEVLPALDPSERDLGADDAGPALPELDAPAPPAEPALPELDTPTPRDLTADLGFIDLEDSGSRPDPGVRRLLEGYLREPQPAVDTPRSSAAELDALLRDYVGEPAGAAEEGGDAVDDLLKRYLEGGAEEPTASSHEDLDALLRSYVEEGEE